MKKLSLLFAALLTATVMNLNAATVTKSSFSSPEVSSGSIAMDQHISLLDGGSAFMPGSSSTLNFCADSKYPGLSMTISCSNGTITSFQLTFTLTQNVQIYYNSQAITSGTTVTLSTPASSVVLYSYLSGSPGGQPLATISSITVNYEAQEPDMHDFLHFVSLKDNGSVKLNKYAKQRGPASLTATFEYSKNRIDWTAYDTWATQANPKNTYQGTSIALANGDTIFFRAKGINGLNDSLSYANDYFQFVFGADDSIAAGGNIMSLYDVTCEQDTMTICGLNYLFKDAKQLVSAPKLPATKLAVDCYGRMFYNCTALTQAPELPADTLEINCYAMMFTNCSALTQAPELKATKLAGGCYSSMFQGCAALTQAPALPATTSAVSCYSNMFKKCTSLTTAPALPATTLEKDCYWSMFEGCTALIQAPELKATTLAESCYLTMFKNCSKLEVDTFSLICDGAELVVPSVSGDAPLNWNKDMFIGCNGNAVGNIQLGGHYCIREYGKPRPIYGRKVTNGNFGTICLDKQFVAMEGVEGLFVPYEKNDTVLFCEEVALTDVVAGGAYIFKSNADSVTFAFEGEAASAVNNDHMIGWLEADNTLAVESDYYGLNGNTLIKLAAGSTIKQNRAVIDLDNVSTGTPAPGRKYVSFGINTPTGLMQNAECTMQSGKMIINGQLIIIRDGKKFNAMGQEL